MKARWAVRPALGWPGLGQALLDLVVLDPRAKLGATLVLMLPLLLRPLPSVIVVYLALLSLTFLSSGQARAMARGLLPIVWLALGLAIFTAMMTSDERHWLAGLLPVSPVGAVDGALQGLRLVELVALGTALATSTPPLRMAAGVQWLLRPLRRLGVDVQALGLVVLLVARFVPLFTAELATTERAMFLRGARFGRGPVDQARRLSALAIPVLGRLLVAADALAATLVSRGYGLQEQPPLADLRFGRSDVALLGMSVTIAAVSLLI